MAAEQGVDGGLVDALTLEHGPRLGGSRGVVVRVAGSPGGLVAEQVGHAADRLLPAVEADDERVSVPDLFGLEADVARPNWGESHR